MAATRARAAGADPGRAGSAVPPHKIESRALQAIQLARQNAAKLPSFQSLARLATFRNPDLVRAAALAHLNVPELKGIPEQLRDRLGQRRSAPPPPRRTSPPPPPRREPDFTLVEVPGTKPPLTIKLKNVKKATRASDNAIETSGLLAEETELSGFPFHQNN
jgi:hypothetical protein